MRELILMWQNTRMIVLTAISAAAYVAVLVPFKGFVLIPGLTEVRPGAAIPVVLSFLFGPAAAWGTGFGNLIADALGGMFGPGSIPGFIGNFLYAYLPYAMWRATMGQASPAHSGLKGWCVYTAIVVTACLTIGAVIGWGVDLLKLVPFAALGPIIAINNLIASAAISTVLLALLFSRIENWGLLYYQVMGSEQSELPPADSTTTADTAAPAAAVERSSARRKLALAGVALCVAGAAIAFFTGLFISIEVLHMGYGAAAFSGQSGTQAIGSGMLPGLVVLLVGTALL